jgi:uncharacterized DUF497 family protein
MAAHRNDFRWDPHNVGQVQKHGLSVEDVQRVVRGARHPYPRRHRGKNGWEVRGRIRTGELIQVLYFIDEWDSIYVYHAM